LNCSLWGLAPPQAPTAFVGLRGSPQDCWGAAASPHHPTLPPYTDQAVASSPAPISEETDPLNIWAKKRGYLLHSLSELTLMRCDLNMAPPSDYRPHPLPSQCFLDRAVAYLSELEDCLWHGGSPNHWTPQVSNHVCQLCRKQGPDLLCDFVEGLSDGLHLIGECHSDSRSTVCQTCTIASSGRWELRGRALPTLAGLRTAEGTESAHLFPRVLWAQVRGMWGEGACYCNLARCFCLDSGKAKPDDQVLQSIGIIAQKFFDLYWIVQGVYARGYAGRTFSGSLREQQQTSHD